MLHGEVDRSEAARLKWLATRGNASSQAWSQYRFNRRGGLAICDEIRKADYDVLARRPTVGKSRQLRLIAKSWWTSLKRKSNNSRKSGRNDNDKTFSR